MTMPYRPVKAGENPNRQLVVEKSHCNQHGNPICRKNCARATTAPFALKRLLRFSVTWTFLPLMLTVLVVAVFLFLAFLVVIVRVSHWCCVVID